MFVIYLSQFTYMLRCMYVSAVFYYYTYKRKALQLSVPHFYQVANAAYIKAIYCCACGP